MALKILHITFSDSGGAGTAALRLHKGLSGIGLQSKILVLEKRTQTTGVFEYPKKNRYFILFLRVLKKMQLPQTLEHRNDNLYKSFDGEFEYFSFARTSFINLAEHPLVKECDVVNLHWIPNFVDYPTFFEKLEKPIVWTQHDMNAFQGGFHYREDNIRNPHLLAINHEQYLCKLASIKNLPSSKMIVVSPSKWLMNEARSSEILRGFRHFHIPNGLDSSVFNFKKQQPLKAKFKLDTNKITVLFISETVKSIRKGFKHILELIEDDEVSSRFQFVAVGNIKKAQRKNKVLYLGSIHSEQEISEIYSAADIYLLPSREDNFPNVMLESLASGTPVVGFNIGGLKDLIVNGQNGYLSDEISTEGLKVSLLRCANKLNMFNRKLIAETIGGSYSIQVQAEAYKHIYEEITSLIN
ncbi:glycosyltransferase [Pedobacter agri]|uniref:Glycosyltransferase n=1 Tax=Pedobacter agri TaxID=454586 RepID=A0A9X3I7S9_9SPHI|nr:glycosyltransferase [Pedobacter agri]MCX3264026.1 glycosyltransferase [Pedobacter agri]